MTETVLDQHMAVMGRVIAKFVSAGLMPHDIDTGEAEKFLGTAEDQKVFGAVIDWMLDEGIIRSKHVSRMIDGTTDLRNVQLTAKGLAIVKQPLPGGDTIERRLQSETGGNAFWSSIGDLVGGFAGGFTKSIAGGG